MKKSKFSLIIFTLFFMRVSSILAQNDSFSRCYCERDWYEARELDPRQCLFERYESPVTPPLFRQGPLNNRTGSDFHLAVLVHFDTAGYVKSLEFSRLAGLGNELSPQDTLWTLAETAVREASKNWKAKPLLWHNLDVPPGGFDDNTQAWNRPNGGFQSHLIIFEFRQAFIDDGGDLFDRIYMLGTRG